MLINCIDLRIVLNILPFGIFYVCISKSVCVDIKATLKPSGKSKEEMLTNVFIYYKYIIIVFFGLLCLCISSCDVSRDLLLSLYKVLLSVQTVNPCASDKFRLYQDELNGPETHPPQLITQLNNIKNLASKIQRAKGYAMISTLCTGFICVQHLCYGLKYPHICKLKSSSPGLQKVTVFRDRVFTEVLKLKRGY